MRATITKVHPEARRWNSPQFPDGCSVSGLFSDNSAWELGTKIGEPCQRHLAAIEALVGQELEFEVEPKPEYKGQRQWKLKSYPGRAKPQGGFGGNGGGAAREAYWRNTEDGFRFEQSQMNRRTSLMQSVALHQNVTTEAVLKSADEFYGWLEHNNAQIPQATPNAPERAARPPVPSGPPPGVAVDDEYWRGPGICPSCRAPENAKHATRCPSRPQPYSQGKADPFVAVEKDIWED